MKLLEWMNTMNGYSRYSVLESYRTNVKTRDPIITSEPTLQDSDPFQPTPSGNEALTLTSNSNRTPIIEVFH